MQMPNHGFRVLENEWIELRDGTRLAAQIWLPDETYSTPVPAILEYLPYKKRGGTDERDNVTYPHFAKHGYAGVRVDMRGNGESDGLMADEYTAQELSDGVQVITWIAQQSWCDGNVGMIGISWGGFNGLQIAALKPPELKAIVTVCSTDDRYADDIHYMGGCLLNDNLAWSQQMLSYSSRPPDSKLLDEDWRSTWLKRLDNMPFLAANWLKHQRRDEFWKHGSVCENYADIQIPVLVAGGWYDAYTNAALRLLSGLAGPVNAIIGPWEHRYPHISMMTPNIDFLGECVNWWDCWLKGQNNGADAMPALRAFMMTKAPASARTGTRDGHWVSHTNWPSADIVPHKFYLTGQGGLQQTAGSAATAQVSSPLDLGQAAGNFCPGMRVDDEFPDDQGGDDAKSTVFDSEPLTEDIAILGAPELEFEFTSTTPNAILVARLCDVAPDGSSYRVCVNPLNLTHLDSHEEPSALIPGQNYRARLKLGDAGYIFAKGHRIRLALSTNYWPLLWPSAKTPVIELQLAACTLSLPERTPDDQDQTTFQPAPPAPENIFDVLRPATNSRDISHAADGMVLVDLNDDMGHMRNRDNALETAATVRHRYWIIPGDPLSAKVEAAWEFETYRANWSVKTRSSSTMTCDAENFFLTARLEAFESGEPVFDRTWHETIERDHV